MERRSTAPDFSTASSENYRNRQRSQSGISRQGRPASKKPASARRPASASAGTRRSSTSAAGTRRPSAGAPQKRRPSSAKGTSQRSTAARPSSGHNTSRQAALRRKQALRKRRLRTALATVILIAVIALVVFILISVLTVPEPKELSIESSSSTQILSWKGSPKGISYQIYRKTGSSDFELAGSVPEGQEHSFVSSGLEGATMYEYKVVAVKGTGEKAKESKGETIQAYTLPETVTHASAVTLSKDSLTLSWPEITGINNYEIRFGTTEDLSTAEVLEVAPSSVEKDATTGECKYTVKDLTVGTTYYFSVGSVCGKEEAVVHSEWSDTYSGIVTKAVDMTGIDVQKPMVAVTYDDGPDNGAVTNRILDALNAVGGHATFFQLGQLCEAYPEVTNRIVQDGNQIACHTYDHEHMGGSVTEYDIVHGNDAIESVCGVRPSAFRATGGESSPLIVSTCTAQGQPLYHWSVDTRDWSSRDADSVVSIIQQNVSDGDIILMHNIYESTASASERIIPWLVEQGYQLVTCDQLVQAKTGLPPEPGKEYHTATNVK